LDFPADPKSKFMLFFFVFRLPTSAKTEPGEFTVAIILVGRLVGVMANGLRAWLVISVVFVVIVVVVVVVDEDV
jgi:hypothetical protein